MATLLALFVAISIWLENTDECSMFSQKTVSFRLPDVNEGDEKYKVITKPAIRFRVEDLSFERWVGTGDDTHRLALKYTSKVTGSVTAYKNDKELPYEGEFWACNKCSKSPLFVRWKGGTEKSTANVFDKCLTPVLHAGAKSSTNWVSSWFKMLFN